MKQILFLTVAVSKVFINKLVLKTLILIKQTFSYPVDLFGYKKS